MLFTQLCSRHVLQAPVLSLGQRLTCLNDHFKYFPECFHTHLRGSGGTSITSAWKSTAGTAQDFRLAGLCHYTFCEDRVNRSRPQQIHHFTGGNLFRLCTLVHGHCVKVRYIWTRVWNIQIPVPSDSLNTKCTLNT